MSMNGMPPILSPRSENGVQDFHSPSYEASGSSDSTSPGFDRRVNPRKRPAPSYEQESHSHQHPSPQTPSSQSFHRPRRSSSTLMPPPPPLPSAHIDQEQTLPSPALSHVFTTVAPIYIPGYGSGPRWMMGSTTSYAKATLTIGRDDPRMNAISIGLVPMERARSLFML